MKRIYLDYASLTPTDKKVLKVMKKYETGDYMNPSSLYSSGVAAKKILIESKEKIAKILHAHPDEIIFTSGGTESNKLVLESVGNKGITISSIEHSSIIRGIGATHIPVDKDGLVDLEILKKSINANTSLVSIMMVNNEIGTIESIHEIAKIVRDAGKKFNKKILFHTDASQAMYLPLHVEKLGVDLMTLDGNKICGPRGIGMLYVKRGSAEIKRLGTENIPAIAGFALALEMADKMMDKEARRLAELKKYFIEGLFKINPKIKINGDLEKTSSHILNVSIPSIDNEFFVLQLDARGVECSTRSACLTDEDESYVLKAIGVESKTAVRFSFGRETKMGDMKKVLQKIKEIMI